MVLRLVTNNNIAQVKFQQERVELNLNLTAEPQTITLSRNLRAVKLVCQKFELIFFSFTNAMKPKFTAKHTLIN